MNNSESQKPTVVFLLAIWGNRYIDHFFQYGLRSLLAPGNIPAMSEEYACIFLFLTKEENFAYFKSQAEYKQLESFCQIEFLAISDLIFEGHSAATLTFAYERGMRSRREKMCSTYFFYLVADLIFADGALKNLIPYMKEGYSGITAGSFSVIEERFTEILKTNNGTIALSAHELLSHAFKHIHPVSICQMVTQTTGHTDHSNRLFWKVDDQVMVGRFYLRHMHCIKPEVEDYVIGSSCDYSFISELCPSGRVMHIQDSDTFCAIEMAPYAYGQDHINEGPYTMEILTKNLSEWTTSIHRANAYLPFVFHSRDLEEPPTATIEASHCFIQKIEAALPTAVHPIRGHPYWLACLDSIVKMELQRIPSLGWEKKLLFATSLWNSLARKLKRKDRAQIRYQCEGKRASVIVVAKPSFCELSALVKKCGDRLPEGSSISVYIKHPKPVREKTFKQALVAFITDVGFAGIVCEKKEIHYSFSQRKKITSATFVFKSKKISNSSEVRASPESVTSEIHLASHCRGEQLQT